MGNNTMLHKISYANRYGWAIIVFGFLGFIVWSALFHIDHGIGSSGHVISTGRSISVTASIAGTVKKIYKKNDETVVSGDIVMELFVRPVEPKDRDMFNATRLLEASNVSLSNAYLSRKQQIEALDSQYKMAENLVSSGFATKNYLSTIEVQLTTAISDSFEIKSRIEENETKLRDLKEKIGSFKVAPASGRLSNINLKQDSIVHVGERLFNIQPISDDLLVSIKIPADYVSQIQNGLVVSLIFPTLPGGTAVFFEGKLEHISNDRKVDEKINFSYFEGLVVLPNSKQVESLNIQTGLPVTAIIKAGRRTLLSYITRPFKERVIRGLH